MSKLAELLVDARRSIEYLAERVVLDVTGDIDRLIRERDMTRAELAQRIGASPAYVSKVLRGETNLTVKTMVSLADALEADVQIRVVDRKVAERWHAHGRWQTVGAVEAAPQRMLFPAIDLAAANEQQWQTLQPLAA